MAPMPGGEELGHRVRLAKRLGRDEDALVAEVHAGAYVSTLPRLKLLERTPSRLTRHAREGRASSTRWCRKLLRTEATGSRSNRAMTRSWRPREGWFSRVCSAVAFRRVEFCGNTELSGTLEELGKMGLCWRS